MIRPKHCVCVGGGGGGGGGSTSMNLCGTRQLSIPDLGASAHLIQQEHVANLRWQGNRRKDIALIAFCVDIEFDIILCVVHVFGKRLQSIICVVQIHKKCLQQLLHLAVAGLPSSEFYNGRENSGQTSHP